MDRDEERERKRINSLKYYARNKDDIEYMKKRRERRSVWYENNRERIRKNDRLRYAGEQKESVYNKEWLINKGNELTKDNALVPFTIDQLQYLKFTNYREYMKAKNEYNTWRKEQKKRDVKTFRNRDVRIDKIKNPEKYELIKERHRERLKTDEIYRENYKANVRKYDKTQRKKKLKKEVEQIVKEGGITIVYNK